MDRTQPVNQTDARQKASKQSFKRQNCRTPKRTVRDITEKNTEKIQKKYKEIQRNTESITSNIREQLRTPTCPKHSQRTQKSKKRYLNIQITATYLRKRSLRHRRRREPPQHSRSCRQFQYHREYCHPFREASESMRYSRYTSAQSGSLS